MDWYTEILKYTDRCNLFNVSTSEHEELHRVAVHTPIQTVQLSIQ